MSKQTVAQQTPTTSPLSQGGILQRKCETCGQHTVAGGECEQCQSKALFIQRHTTSQTEPSEVLQFSSSTSNASNLFTDSACNRNFNLVKIRTFTPSTIQAKLSISQSGDKYEQEADQIAEKIVQMSATKMEINEQEEKEKIQTKPIVSSITPLIQKETEQKEEIRTIQTKFTDSGATNITASKLEQSSLQNQLNVAKTNGFPLAAKVQTEMETAFGADFSPVRIHTGATAHSLARSLHANAFTLGTNIFFRESAFNPTNLAGKRLLTHELTHVVQQNPSLKAWKAPQSGQPQSLGHTSLVQPPIGILQTLPSTTDSLIQKGNDEETEKESRNLSIEMYDEKGNQVFSTDKVGQFIRRNRTKLPPGVYKYEIFSEGGVYKVKVNGEIYVLEQYPKDLPDLLKKVKDFRLIVPGVPEITKVDEEIVVTATAPGKTGKEKKEGKEQAGKQTGDNKGSAAVPPKNSENLGKLKALPEKIKLLLGGEGTFTPENSEQLLRIADKLQKLKPEDLELYKLLVTELTKDLNVFEQSIDVYMKIKEQYRVKLEEIAQQKQQQKKEPTLEEKLAKPFEGFDAKKFGTMQRAEKEALARKIADQQTQIQLQHMAEHPGETVKGMAESVVRVDQLAKAVYKDVIEAASGDKNAFARWAAGVGATGKLSGWVAAVAGILYVGLLFVPGVNVAVLAKTAMALMVTTIVLSTVEGELRIQAAAEAKTPEDFQIQTTKAAVAQANVAMAIAMLVFSLVLKVIARTPIPGRLKTVGGAFKAARTALLEKTGAGAALESIRASLLEKLKGTRSEIPKGINDANKSLNEWNKLIEGMTGDELVKKLAAGDQALQDLTNISPEIAKQIQEIVNTPAGKGVADKLRADILKALKDAPTETGKQLNNVSDNLDKAVSDIEKAKTPEELKNAIDVAEKNLSPEALSQEAEASKQAYVKEKITAERYQGKSDAEVKSAAMTDPAAVDELIRRYELKTVKELEKLSKAGDGTADYVLGKRRSAGYKKPSEVPLRPSNLAVLDRLKVYLEKLRQSTGIIKEGSSGGTLGVAATDLPLAKTTFEGASPKVGGKPDPSYKPPTDFPSAQSHAEQNLVGALKKEILNAKLTPEQMKGKTVYMLIEQEVCATCKAGAYNQSAGAGVLKQFSLEFPDLTVEIMNLESSEVLRFRGGQAIK